MSEVITTDVFCDVDGCGHWVDGVTGASPDRNAARKIARSKGWEVRGNEAICPRHSDKAGSPGITTEGES